MLAIHTKSFLQTGNLQREHDCGRKACRNYERRDQLHCPPVRTQIPTRNILCQKCTAMRSVLRLQASGFRDGPCNVTKSWGSLATRKRSAGLELFFSITCAYWPARTATVLCDIIVACACIHTDIVIVIKRIISRTLTCPARTLENTHAVHTIHTELMLHALLPEYSAHAIACERSQMTTRHSKFLQ